MRSIYDGRRPEPPYPTEIELAEALAEIESLRSKLSASEAQIVKAKSALDLDGEDDALDNLAGALIDLQRTKTLDGVCERTLERIMKQLADVETALKGTPQ